MCVGKEFPNAPYQKETHSRDIHDLPGVSHWGRAVSRGGLGSMHSPESDAADGQRTTEWAELLWLLVCSLMTLEPSTFHKKVKFKTNRETKVSMRHMDFHATSYVC